jgi:hypothetical protein
VAAYDSLEGAERAATHLVRLGYDEVDVGIGPRDFEVVDDSLRRLLRRWLKLGALVGIALAGVIALVGEVGADALLRQVLPAVAWGAVAGLALGLVAALFAYWRHRARAFPAPPEVVAPTRFEILVEGDREQARHRLARWWDPEAPPAGSQGPA